MRPWPGLDAHGPLRLGLDRPGLTQALGGLVLGLIALFSSYDHISLGGYRISLQQQWGILCIAASVATIFSMLNWRRDPDYERRMNALRSDRERIENDILQVEKEIERIESETEQLRRENARLRALNAKAKILLSYVDQHCFPPESSSIPIPPAESDSRSF